MNELLVKLLRVYIIGDMNPDVIDMWEKRIALLPDVANFREYLLGKYKDELDPDSYLSHLDYYRDLIREWPDSLSYFQLAFGCIVWCEELEKSYLEIRSERIKTDADFILNEKEPMNGGWTTFRDYRCTRSDAIDCLNKIIEKEPDLPVDITAYLLKNIVELRETKWWMGYISPRGSDIHCRLGMDHEDNGNIEEAIKEYRFALKLDPNHATVKECLCWILRKKKNYEEAEVLLEEIIKDYPHIPRGYILLAELYREQGRFDESTILGWKIDEIRKS
jgi:tetratricopeptide (TPR) repeat protein